MKEININLLSYLILLCGITALYYSGGLSILYFFPILASFIISLWLSVRKVALIGDRLGLLITVLSLPVFYIFWKSEIGSGVNASQVGVRVLGYLIVFLSLVKSLQNKSSKDWFFLYVISFFQILLAAGLSISPALLLIFTTYVLLLITAVYLYEMNASVSELESEISLHRFQVSEGTRKKSISNVRLFTYSLVCVCAVLLVGVPLFLAMPRGHSSSLGGGGSENLGGISTGFSEQVRLGAIGKIQQSDRVVMRVQLDEQMKSESKNLRWRGVTLDYFNNLGWRQSPNGKDGKSLIDKENGFFQLSTVTDISHLTTQTIMLEPLDTNVIFAAPRLVALSGNFSLLTVDKSDNITTSEKSVRHSYKAYSDLREYNVDFLSSNDSNNKDAPPQYLQLPVTDRRIKELAEKIISVANAKTNYEKAVAIERYLQTSYEYSLEMKAGGEEPLADFLFNIRAGHCEYFATAMAIMLRTQNIPTRIVNGFQRGQFNELAGVYIVTEKEAHSWVEVYFPSHNAWVTFDPTPASGFSQENGTAFGAVYLVRLNNFVQALETFWIQYVVGYDGQEQMSLLRSVKSGYESVQDSFGDFIREIYNRLVTAWKLFRESDSFTDKARSVAVIGFYGLVVLALIFSPLLVMRLLAKVFAKHQRRKRQAQVIEFYEKMSQILAKRGFKRSDSQTPLEFAEKVGLSDVVFITDRYNEVRFGERELTRSEVEQIGKKLKELESRREERVN